MRGKERKRAAHLEELPPCTQGSDTLSLEIGIRHDDHVAPLGGLKIGRVFLARTQERQGRQLTFER